MQQISPWTHLVRWAVGLTLFATVVVLGGGSAVWAIERDHPGSNLTEWHDCLWWAAVTLATVGYGEHFPVTLGGRLVAVLVMVVGTAIVGAVAAMVAFGFGHRFAERLEEAVRTVEEGKQGALAETRQADPRGEVEDGALQEVMVTVPDPGCAASLTWLLARLGWHPDADEEGLGWTQGATRLRLVVRPWTTPTGLTGRLTFGAGTTSRVERIARESTHHGFHRVHPPAVPGAEPEVTLRTASGFEIALVPS